MEAAVLFTLAQLVLLSSGEDTPVMETSEIHVNVTRGMTAILPCIVDTITNRSYVVVWMSPRKTPVSMGTRLIAGDRRFTVDRPYEPDWNLHIVRVRGTDSGIYMCTVNTSPVQQKKVHLNVLVPARIIASPNTDVKEGTSFRIFCNVTGTPKASPTWYLGDTPLDNGNGEVLEFSNITRAQAGTYTCRAYNGVNPKSEASIKVDVHYPPEVHTRTPRMSQYLGMSAVLECEVRGNPPVTGHWSRKGKKLPVLAWKYEPQVFSGEDDLVTFNLRIMSLNRNDFGQYSCKASNDVGKDSATIVLSELRTTLKPPSTSPGETTTTDLVTTTTEKSTYYVEKSTGSGGNVDNIVVNPDKEETASQKKTTDGNVVVVPDSAGVGLKSGLVGPLVCLLTTVLLLPNNWRVT